MSDKHKKFIVGFTIIELLVALAITAMLLAAVAVAFNASMTNYTENADLFKTVNNARQALVRMTSQIRTAGYFDTVTGTWYGVAYNSAPSNQCILYKPDHELITYEFRSAEHRLYLIRNATHQEYVLCDNVVTATFTTTSDNGVDAKSVQISMMVGNGSAEQTFSAAAVVRKVLER
jgi:prepilin-type N-terminal cleavage/methylation domain-containing protein